MPKDRYKLKIECSECGNEAIAKITENEGFSFSRNGPQRVVAGVFG